MLRDARYSIRLLLRNPLVASVAVLSLALGIGGAASVFTVLSAIVLRDLPLPNPQQLYAAEKHRASDVSTRYSWPLVEQARQELQGRAEIFAATTSTQMQVRLARGTDGAERSNVQLVSGGFFDALRQRAQLGRLIEPGDTSAVSANPVMVISDAYWRRRFQADPAIIGRELIVGSASLTVIGVTAPGFFGPFLAFRNPDVWVPLTMQDEIRYAFNASTSDESDGTKPWAIQPGIEWLSLFARVPDAASANGVGSALTLLHQRDASTRLDASSAEDRTRLDKERIVLTSAGRGVSFLRGDLSSRLFVLLAMLGVLVAITCGNVASLLVARASAREREIAVRIALGAGRWRVVRQLIWETMMLAAVGGALGLIVAAWGRDLLLAMFTGGATTIDLDTSFDWRVLLFTVSLTGLCGLAAGILPALRSTRVAPTEAIKAQARQVGHAGGRRGAAVGKVLVAAQMAFCLLLLIVAGLFVRSMQVLSNTDVGFDRDRLLVARMDVRSMGFSEEQRQALYDRVLERLRGIPGVVAASASLNGPLGTSSARQQPDRRGVHPGTGRAAPDQRRVRDRRLFRDRGARAGRGPRLHDRGQPAGQPQLDREPVDGTAFLSCGRRSRQAVDVGRCDPGRVIGDHRGRAGREISWTCAARRRTWSTAFPVRRLWTCSAISRFARRVTRRRWRPRCGRRSRSSSPRCRCSMSCRWISESTAASPTTG